MPRAGKSSPSSESQESVFPATYEDVSKMIQELANRVTDLKIFMNHYMKELALPENVNLDIHDARAYVKKLSLCSVVFLQQYTLLMHGLILDTQDMKELAIIHKEKHLLIADTPTIEECYGKQFKDFVRDKDLLSPSTSSHYHYSKLCIKWIEHLLKYNEKDNHLTPYRDTLVSYMIFYLKMIHLFLYFCFLEEKLSGNKDEKRQEGFFNGAYRFAHGKIGRRR